MGLTMIKLFLLFATTMAMLGGINCQLAAIAIRLPEIVNLLENVTDTSTSFVPQLASLLKNQEDVQVLTNLLLENNTVAAEEVAAILPGIERFFQEQQGNQDQLVSLLQNQEDYQNTTTTFLQNHQDAVSRMEASLAQMANSLDQMVSLLQIQSQQLGNATHSLFTMVNQLNEQNQIVRNIADCSYLSVNDQSSTVTTISPDDGLGSFQVFCDMDTDGGGWTVFQQRFDGFVDFFRGWDDYENGFGSVWGEHWLGLRQIYRLTRRGNWTLRIDLEDFDGNTAYAEYEDFKVGNATTFYRLSTGAFSGTVPNGLRSHNNQPFSTKDNDHDSCSSHCVNGSCAQKYHGAWWYYSCLASNLNGQYTMPTQNAHTEGATMSWVSWPVSGRYVPLKKSEMKIRRT